MSDIQVWPKDWPQYKQACFSSFDSRCDLLVGPCACGAWHMPGEFEYTNEVLIRYGENLRECDVRHKESTDPSDWTTIQ